MTPTNAALRDVNLHELAGIPCIGEAFFGRADLCHRAICRPGPPEKGASSTTKQSRSEKTSVARRVALVYPIVLRV